MIRNLWIFALLLAGCATSSEQVMKMLPTDPGPQISGTYVITLDGFVDSGLPTPALNVIIKQDDWQGNTAKLEISGNANGGFCATNGVQWATEGTISKDYKLSITITLGTDATKTVLTIASDDFKTSAGTWRPGPAMSSCNGFTTTGPGFTWKAVKQ